jgi:hypothetical protein
MNQKRLDKKTRGTMYDAFRSRMNDNTTDEDLVMESKILKGYGNNPAYGKTSNDRLTNEVITYMKKQRPMNATDLMTQQQYTDLFNRHFDPMQITLNEVNSSTVRLNNDFNTFGNENLAALGKQRANMKNMNTTMQGLDTTMQGIDGLLRTQIDNQGIAINNNTNANQAMLDAINNLNPNQQRRGRSAPGRRSSGVTDVPSPT